MKPIIIILGFFLPAFFPFNCGDDIKINCPVNLTLSDFTGTYRADNIETLIMCDTSSHSVNSFMDSLNYSLQLNDDWTGRIFGPDTLTDFEWIFENIASSSGSSGGCYQTFTVWTQNRKIQYGLTSAGVEGIGFYLTDSTWNYKNCVRQKFYYFKRVE